MSEKKWSITDGLFSHNPVFCAGMSLAPAIILGETLNAALTYAAVFSAVTFVSLMLASFLPRKIPYALRIILYTLTAAVVYIPVHTFFDDRLPVDIARLGVFLPMIATGEFMVNSAEMRFFRMERGRMTLDVLSHIIGFDAAIIFLGAFRELFSAGELGGELYGIKETLPLLASPCGGFILIGLIGALIRLCTRR